MRTITASSPLNISRKCSCCKENICINRDTIDDAIFYDKKSYHRNCFIELCNKRANMKRIDIAEKWQWVQRNINHIKLESKYHFSEAISKEDINQFIMKEYDIAIIPSSVWQKLSNIYKGTFRGMSVGIPPNELIDMWKRKIEYLNKVANQNVTKGKIMNPDQRLNYDLSILINKYDGYKKWKRDQKILESNNQYTSENNFISTGIIKEVSKKSTDKNNDGEMSDLVDDIFS